MKKSGRADVWQILFSCRIISTHRHASDGTRFPHNSANILIREVRTPLANSDREKKQPKFGENCGPRI